MTTRATPPAVDPAVLYHNQLLRHAYARLGAWDDAEDVVQEAFVRWCRAGEKHIQSPIAWLTTIVNRLCIDRIRRMRRESIVSNVAEFSKNDERARPDELLSRWYELANVLSLMVCRLSPDQRAALVLREAFHWSYEDVADALGKSNQTCRQIVRRARLQLRSACETSRGRDDDALLERFWQAFKDGDAARALELIGAGVCLRYAS